VEAGPTEEDVRVSLEQVGELIERLRHALRSICAGSTTSANGRRRRQQVRTVVGRSEP